MRNAIWIAVAVLVILHQDNWFWDDDTIVLGFLPIGLAWHMGISIAASFLWYLATIFAWPKGTDFVPEEADA